jgi:ribonuclease T2
MRRNVICLVVMAFCWSGLGIARKHKTQGEATFDYYLLSLSWAPNYCADHPTDRSSECRTGNHTAFVLHGLWPSANNGAQPMSCKPASPVAASTVSHMLEYFPNRGLIQHEWEKHGTCSGLSAQQYFSLAEQAYSAVQVPDRYRSLDRLLEINVKDLEQDFAQANHAPPQAFRVSCHAGALVALEACLDKDLHYVACPRSARECPSPQVEMGPVK